MAPSVRFPCSILRHLCHIPPPLPLMVCRRRTVTKCCALPFLQSSCPLPARHPLPVLYRRRRHLRPSRKRQWWGAVPARPSSGVRSAGSHPILRFPMVTSVNSFFGVVKYVGLGAFAVAAVPGLSSPHRNIPGSFQLRSIFVDFGFALSCAVE